VDISQVQAEVLRLLGGSPITSDQVIADVRESVAAGEVALAFDTLCSWIYEDSLPISREYLDRLAVVANDVGLEKWVSRLEGLVKAG
jgi:hypothetical protein